VHPLERFVAILGAAACLLITIVISRSVSAYQAMWPLPGLYFIEIASLGVLSALAVIRGDPAGRVIVWGAVGIFAAFCILGAFSVGFSYLPVTFLFAAVSISSDARNKQHIAPHLAVCLVAALAQAALMLAAIRLLDSGGVF
jgi:hypothetical protein